MRGLGTITNLFAVIGGGIFGVVLKSFLKERYQETIIKATGFAIVFLGMAGALAKMLRVNQDGSLSVGNSMIMILSLAIGGFVGEILNFEAQCERFGEWLKYKSGSAKDKEFVNAFVTTSLTISIGAMAIIGSIQDGIYGDHSILFAKAILDFIIVFIMTTSLGKGCIFSFIPVAVLQGGITALALVLSGVMTEQVVNSISLVGNTLVFCAGINLVLGKTIRVANLLPSLIIAIFLGKII